MWLLIWLDVSFIILLFASICPIWFLFPSSSLSTFFRINCVSFNCVSFIILFYLHCWLISNNPIILVVAWGLMHFPGGSNGKESASNAGDLGLIPGLERSPGEGNGYPLQSSCLGNPIEELGTLSPWGCKESNTTEGLSLSWGLIVHIFNLSQSTFTSLHI